MSAGPTVLFQSHNRRGLGHLMRGLNIAREVLSLRPDARVVMHTRNATASSFCPAGVTCLVDDGSGSVPWPTALTDLAPDIVVYDTLVPPVPDEEPIPPGARVAYVMRRTVDEEYRRLIAGGFLDRCHAIVVPHSREEFGHDVPDALRRRTVFCGTITRRPDASGMEQVRLAYGLRRGVPLLVSTAGGGGFADTAVPFFDAVVAVHRLLVARLGADVQHVVILGPHYAGRAPRLPGAHVRRVEPNLVDLFALADLVLSEGGYNSVSELRFLGVPAVFIPGRRRLDDQAERVAPLVRAGSARVLDAAPAEVAAEVTTLLTDQGRLAAMRRRAAAARFDPGNRVAASHVLGVQALTSREAEAGT